jgi:flagellar biosynthesis anti-sigma factor FlgM
MAVRIQGPVPQGNVGRSTNRTAAKKKEAGDEKTGSSERVDLSAREAAVSAVQSSSVNEVDEAKVAELREKIASGEYQSDLKLVAERLIAEAIAMSK